MSPRNPEPNLPGRREWFGKEPSGWVYERSLA